MQTPILMIHGMCCTGDVWTQFRSFFEARGAKVYTPTLRPEQRVNRNLKPTRALSTLSLHDYVADLEQEVDRIERETGERPAVIGHSMGGLLAQALVERDRAVAGVFISPAAPAGVGTLLTQAFWGIYGLAHRVGLTHGIIRPDYSGVSTVVLNRMPKQDRRAVADAMVYESGKVFAEFANFPIDEHKVRVPTLTIAATRDLLVTAPVVRKVGKKYKAVGGDFKEYREHGHWLYAEPGWEKPAAEIFTWLETAIERSKSERPAAAVQVQA